MGVVGRRHRGLHAAALGGRQRLHDPIVLPAAVDPRGDGHGSLPRIPAGRLDHKLEAGAADKPLYGGVQGVRVEHIPAEAARHDRGCTAGVSARAPGRVCEEEEVGEGGGDDVNPELIEHAGQIFSVNLLLLTYNYIWGEGALLVRTD